MKNGIVLFLLMTIGLPLAMAQLSGKHPRVSELEDKMTQDIRDLITARFPDTPFLIDVEVTPLRRDIGSNYEIKAESLPYLDIESEAIRDEWDDPKSTLYELSLRIQRASIKVEVPLSLTQADIGELKESVTKRLRLMPARDNVSIDRKDWLSQSLPYENFIGAFAIALISVLIGLFFVHYFSARGLGRILAKTLSAKSADGADKSGGGGPMALPGDFGGMGGSASGRGGDFNDVQFRDPLKTRELVATKVQQLLKAEPFPVLDDLIQLDRFAKKSLPGLGALMAEFPIEMQMKIFSLCPDDTWLEAFAEPGELSINAVDVLDKMIRVRPDKAAADWQNFLIQVWRMESAEKIVFLKTLPREEAMAILDSLPKSISLPVAREVFPGGWGLLLDTSHKHTRIPDQRVSTLYQQSLTVKPHLDYKELRYFQEEKDLLAYLRSASLQEEREVYGAYKDSRLTRLRPAFFPVFQADPMAIKTLVPMFSVVEWSLALFNVDRELRRLIEAELPDKQKFLFFQYLKKHDLAKPSAEIQGETRERIARAYHSLKIQLDGADAAQNEIDALMNESSDAKAA